VLDGLELCVCRVDKQVIESFIFIGDITIRKYLESCAAKILDIHRLDFSFGP